MTLILHRRGLISGAAALAAMASINSPRRALAFPFPVGSGAFGSSGQQAFGIYNVKLDYGAKGDIKLLADGVMSSSSNPTHLSSASASFVSGDIGKTVCVSGAGASGAPLVTTISSISSGTVAVLVGSCLTTVSNTIVHYGTDDTSAFQTMISAMSTARTGIGCIPLGGYMIAGAPGGPSSQNAQIWFPFIAANSLQATLTLVGECPPNSPAVGLTVLNNNPPTSSGSWLFSPINGSGTSPAVISGGPPNLTGSAFNATQLNMGCLTIRTAWLQPNPMIALNNGSFTSSITQSVYFDVDATTNTMALGPPTSGSQAYIPPATQNSGLSLVRDCNATGYDAGFGWGEHGIMDNVDMFLCNYASYIYSAFHDLFATRICPQTCKRGIFKPGGGTATYLTVNNYDTEHNDTGSHWFNSPIDIDDGGNTLNGNLKYFVTKSSVGTDMADFNVVGAAHMLCSAVGAAP